MKNNSVAFIIGNGVSRLSIDLNRLNGITYGCNAIYREFYPDFLVSVDKAMIEEILESDYPKERLIVRSHPGLDIPEIKKLKWRDSCSGISALRLALEKNYEKIVLIGFDLHGLNGKVNNVYASTRNYREAGRAEVGYNYWINQLEQYATKGKVERILGKESLPLKNLQIDRELHEIFPYYE